MKYYLLDLGSMIQKKTLYRIEFIKPYCITKLIKKISNNVSYFILTDDEDCLYKFFNVKYIDKLFYEYYLLYNKGNLANIFYIAYSNIENGIKMYLTSKNFDKYYSYDETGTLEKYNELICNITYYYDYKEYFYVTIIPFFILSRIKNSKEYVNTIIKYRSILHINYIFESKEFKQFDTFKDLVLYCIESDKEQFFSEYKDLSKNEKLIFNEYYDILIDVAKGIEL